MEFCMAKPKAIAEFGDFQTPEVLAAQVCRLLAKQNLRPKSLVEPTCGVGAFLFAGLDQFKSIEVAVGYDINRAYIEKAKATLKTRSDVSQVKLIHEDFFAADWQKHFVDLPGPVLVIGNLPWVTNSHLESLGSTNLPDKTNFQRRNGLDALTGKANFDISEWMLIRILETMNGRIGTLAMLCKSSVARKTLFHAWNNGIGLKKSAIYRIDADAHFDAAVDAALLVTNFCATGDKTAKVYQELDDHTACATIGFEDGKLFADLDAYHKWKHLCGSNILIWRSGVKHDCSKVMEFRKEGQRFRNGLDELVELELTYMFPMLKSSDVANGCADADRRWMLVTQTTVGEETSSIEAIAPLTWRYLQDHAAYLARRGSSIYKDRARFSIFGVGDYSFSPWKVAISGFYKRLNFSVVGPTHDKPVVLDDTSYFLPCESKAGANYLAEILNSETAKAFFNAFVFWDAKRPITADLLRRLDLQALARATGSEQQYEKHFGHCAPEKSKRGRKPAKTGEVALLF